MENKQQTGTVWVLRYNCPSGYGREIYGIYASEDAAIDALNDGLFDEYFRLNNCKNAEEAVEPFYNDFDPKIEPFTVRDTIGLKTDINIKN